MPSQAQGDNDSLTFSEIVLCTCNLRLIVNVLPLSTSYFWRKYFHCYGRNTLQNFVTFWKKHKKILVFKLLYQHIQGWKGFKPTTKSRLKHSSAKLVKWLYSCKFAFVSFSKTSKKFLASALPKSCRGSCFKTGLKTCNFIKKRLNTGVFLWILRNF